MPTPTPETAAVVAQDPRLFTVRGIVSVLAADLDPKLIPWLEELSARAGGEPVLASPVPLTEEQQEHVEKLVKQRRAPSTQRAYERAWGRFCAWLSEQCADRDPERQPTDGGAVALYLSELHRQGKSYKTVEQARNAIGAIHRERNWPDPTKDERVAGVLHGISRDPDRTSHKGATPIVEDEFERIQDHLCSNPDRLLDAALISVLRDGLLRRSEAVALRWIDFTPHSEGTGVMLIRRSKTDQTAEGEVVFLTRRSVTLLRQLRAERKSHSANREIFPISESQVNRIIKRAAEEVGLDPKLDRHAGFSGHSLRRGMAVDLARKGASTVEIMQAGRWASANLVAYYIRDELAAENAVARHCA